jgi:hypothetical protein
MFFSSRLLGGYNWTPTSGWKRDRRSNRVVRVEGGDEPASGVQLFVGSVGLGTRWRQEHVEVGG